MASEVPRQAVFLVGGLGTRLGALTRTTPKPLVDVAGRPFLDWLVDAVVAQGVAEVVLLCGYRAAQVETAMARLQGQGVRLVCSLEPEPLGTAGALRHALDVLDDAFWLLNGDSLFHIDLRDLAAPDLDDAAPLARLALRREADAGRYGSVQLDGARVTGFAEKTADGGPGLINGGVYWMRREAVAALTPGAASLERDVFPTLAAQSLLAGRIYDAPFIDIGVPESLALAQTYVPQALG